MVEKGPGNGSEGVCLKVGKGNGSNELDFYQQIKDQEDDRVYSKMYSRVY